MLGHKESMDKGSVGWVRLHFLHRHELRSKLGRGRDRKNFCDSFEWAGEKFRGCGIPVKTEADVDGGVRMLRDGGGGDMLWEFADPQNQVERH